MRAVSALGIQPFKRGVLQHHRGIDARRVRPESNQPFGRFKRFFISIAEKPRHHLNAQLKAVFSDKAAGAFALSGGMPALIEKKHLIVHALTAELY